MTMAVTLGAITSGAGARINSAKVKTGGTLTIGVGSEIASLDPIRQQISGVTTGNDRVLLAYGTLLRLNSKTGALYPGLAESMVSSDAQTWVMKLRPDLRFSDGTPLDADAVIFNIQRLRDPVNAFPGIATVSGISKMTALDPRTVEFKLSQPDGSFNFAFSDVVGAIGSPTAMKADLAAFGRKPIGAGPFILKEWTRDSQYVYVKNPAYWDKPRPYLDSIVVKIIPDLTTRTSLLQAGDLDVLHDAQTQPLKLIQDDPKNIFGYNPAKVNGGSGIVMNQDKAPGNDVRFREAMSLAFDFKNAKQVFFSDINYPSNKLICAPFGTGSPYCAKDVVAKYDPKRAQKLFDAVKADGISTDFTYTTNNSTPTTIKDAEWVQQELAKYGVKVTPRLLNVTAFVTALSAHDFQAARISNPTSGSITTRYYNDFHSVGGPTGGRDVANLNNASLDVALEKGRTSLTLKDQIAGFQEAQRVMRRDFLVAWVQPNLTGSIGRTTVRLGPAESPNAPVWRYDEAWLKDRP